MAWSNSRIFQQFLVDALDGALAHDLDATSMLKAALYNDSITPDQTVSQANSAYNAGQWANTNEVSDPGQWEDGGEILASNDVTATGGVVKLDATDLASDTSATLASVYGCLVYADSLTPKAGVCFNYFGGPQSVTDGTFTIVWHTDGILSFDLTGA